MFGCWVGSDSHVFTWIFSDEPLTKFLTVIFVSHYRYGEDYDEIFYLIILFEYD